MAVYITESSLLSIPPPSLTIYARSVEQQNELTRSEESFSELCTRLQTEIRGTKFYMEFICNGKILLCLSGEDAREPAATNINNLS